MYFFNNNNIHDNLTLLFSLLNDQNSIIIWNSQKEPLNPVNGIYLYYSINNYIYYDYKTFLNQCDYLTHKIPNNPLLWKSINMNNNFFNIFGLGALYLLKIDFKTNKNSKRYLITDKENELAIWGIYHNKTISNKLNTKFHLYFSWNLRYFLSYKLLIKPEFIFCKLFETFEIKNNKLIFNEKEITLPKNMKGSNNYLIIKKNQDLISNYSKMTISNKHNIEILTKTNTYKLNWQLFKEFTKNKTRKELIENDEKLHLLTELKTYYELWNTKKTRTKKEINEEQKKQFTIILNGEDYKKIETKEIMNEIKKNIENMNVFVNYEEKIVWNKNEWEINKENWSKLSKSTKERVKEMNKENYNIFLCTWEEEEEIKKIRSNLEIFDLVLFLINNSKKGEYIIHFSTNDKLFIKIKYAINQLIINLN